MRIVTAFLLTVTLLFGGFPGIPAVPAQTAPQDMGGWEKDSPYNQLYDPRERERIKGVVDEVMEAVPMPGMKPATAIVLKESEEDKIMVHICPAWYLNTKDVGIKKGDELKIRGVWAEIDGKDVFMAAKIKKGDYFDLKVRLTSDGTPFWTMTPEELAREKASD